MPTFEVIPDHTFAGAGSGTGLVARSTLKAQSTIAEVQYPACALNAPLRFGYGRNRVGALLLAPVVYGSSLLIPYIIGRGPIGGIDAVEFEAAAAHASVGQHTYLGGTDNVLDGWLQAAWAAKGRTYADTLPGIAWGVLSAPARNDVVVTGLTIEARMLKVYDPRDGSQTLGVPTTYKYSANPVLALADFISSPTYGKGETLDWSTVTTCADIADQVPSGGTKVRRSFGLMFDVAMDVDSVEETLRAYAGVWVIREGGTVSMIADAAASSVFAFTNATPSNYVADSIVIREREQKNTPTVVTVKWTDTSVKPWREATVTKPDSGPGAGIPWREEVVAMPGIQDSGFATREAIRRLNEYRLCDLEVQLLGTDEAVVLRRGDVVTVTDSDGFSAKKFRLISHSPQALGRWAETMVEYDPLCYSDVLSSEPSSADSSFALPTSPPTPSGLAVAEEVYQLENGTFASRVRASWTAPTYPFTASYRVEVSTGGLLIESAIVYSATSPVFRSKPLPENLSYVITVAVVSTVAAIGTAATASVTLLGKSAIPGNVATLSGLEAGGRVFLSWSPADNPTIPGTPDPDVWRYEVRYGSTGGSWETASLLDQVDALTFVAETIPPGTWRFYVKAIDSIKQYSASAATRDITVTLDSGAYTAQAHTFVSATLTNMAAWTARPDATQYWTTNFGDGVGYGHADTNNATGTFTDLASTVWPQPHTAGNSAWESESWDTGSSLSGTWTATLNYTLHSGTATVSIMLSADGSTWVTYPGTSAKATGRFVKLRIDITTGSATVAGYPSVTLSQTPRSESVASVTTLSSGGKLVQLANAYSVARTLQLTPIGSTFATAVADRLLVAPVAGLQLVQTMTGGGNCYVYQTIATNARVMASGDYLEYDVWVDPANPNNLAGGFGIYSTTSNWTHTYTFTDQNGIAMLNGDLTGRAGQWYARKAAIPAAFIGQTAANWDLINEADTAGYYRTVYRNIRITDGAGTTRLTIWASGEPAVNSIHIANLQTNNACGPSNSFMAYAFNSGGTQISRDVSVKFEGS